MHVTTYLISSDPHMATILLLTIKGNQMTNKATYQREVTTYTHVQYFI